MHFADHVKWRSEKFGAVVFDTLSEKVYVTNETGNEILRLIEDGMAVPAITERLQEEHLGDETQIQSEIAAFVSELASAGLLVLSAKGQA